MDHEIPGNEAYHLIARSFDDFLKRLEPYDSSNDPDPEPGTTMWIHPDFKEFLDNYR